jgi:hypothetical protein
MGKLTVVLSWILVIIGLGTFVLLGAGSHGHMRPWDHGDSFDLYMIIYGCFTGIAGLNYLNYRLMDRNLGGYRYFNLCLTIALLIVGFMILIATINEHVESYDKDRVAVNDYLVIAAPIGLLIFILFKLIKNKKVYAPQQ